MRYSLESHDAGAIGDGKTDDTLALQHWIDVCDRKGYLAVLGPGEYVVSETLELPSGIIVQGTSGGYLRKCVLRRDTQGAILHIGDVQDVSLSGFQLRSGVMKDTVGVSMYGKTGGYGHKLRDLCFVGLGTGIACIDEDATWQCDKVLIESCRFMEGQHGIHVRSRNADQWKIAVCDIAFGADKDSLGKGIWLDVGGQTTVDTCCGAAYLVDDKPNGDFIDLGITDPVTLIECQAERVRRFLLWSAPPPANPSVAVKLIGCMCDGDVEINTNGRFIAIGTDFNGDVLFGEAATDTYVGAVGVSFAPGKSWRLKDNILVNSL